MQELNLPKYEICVGRQKSKLTIFDFLRRRYVALTPEEWVRQHFVHFLVDHKGYPTSAEALLQAMREEKAEKRKEKAISKLDEKQEFIKQVLIEHGGIMDKADLIKMISQKFNICRATSYNLIKKLDPSQFSLSKDGKALFSLSNNLSNEQTELSFE